MSEPCMSCDLTAIPVEQRAQHLVTAEAVFKMVEAVRELDDGFAFCLPNDGDTFMQVARFIDHERRCCPFYHFTLALESNHGPMWLTLRGSAEIKSLVRTMLGDQTGLAATLKFNTGDNVALAAQVARAVPRFSGIMTDTVT